MVSTYFLLKRKTIMNILNALIQHLVSGKIRIIDLTQPLSAETPIIKLPQEFAQSAPFKIEEISKYDERGPAWYWNNFSCGEHTGTHFDAPIHWLTGKELPNNSTDTIPVENFIAPAIVIDVVEKSKLNPDFLLKISDILAWETQYGQIPANCWVLLHTNWSKRARADFLNIDEDGNAHSPGASAEVIKFLISERHILGWGSECVGQDAGLAATLTPPVPCHNLMHGANKYGLASLINLDQLPPTGALIIAAPLKIINGSGSPCRVMALIQPS